MTSKLSYLGKVNQSKYLHISTRNCKPHPRMSHRFDKGWTEIFLFLFRDAPLEIARGRIKHF